MFSIRVYGGLICLKQNSKVFRVQDIRSMTVTSIQNKIIKRVSPSNTLNSRFAFALPKFTNILLSPSVNVRPVVGNYGLAAHSFPAVSHCSV
jgi:hypothetical protein